MASHEEALRVARRYAEWHLGDASWANLIVGAYNNSEAVNAELDLEMSEGDN